MVLVVSLATSALAAPLNELCFKEADAKKLLLEIKAGSETSKQLDLCFKQYSTLKRIEANDKLLITGLRKDKEDLKGVSDTFKEQLINKNTELTECKDSKPSRLTWFGAGFIAALITGIAVAFAAK